MDRTKLTLTEKQKHRIESKKKKAKAFIDLIIDKESHRIDMDQSDSGSSGQAKIPGVTMTIDDYRKLVQQKYTQKIMSMERPKLYLCVDDWRDKPDDPQPLLYMTDLQRLLLCMLQGPRATIKPRWCRLLRVSRLSHIVVVVLNGVSDLDFTKYEHCFPSISATFKTCVDMVCSEQYGISLTDEIFVVQPAPTEKKTIKSSTTNKQNWKIPKEEQTTANGGGDEQSVVNAGIDVRPVVSRCGQYDRFLRTTLILNKSELIQERFPVPVHTKANTYMGFAFTRDNYTTPTAHSPMFGVDCEMCLTTLNTNELTRISIVNEKLEVIYDTMVKPHNKIINYLTQYSGITKSLLSPIKTRLSHVQQAVRSLLPDDAILVGHSLCGDLRAMKMFHPYVIDSSVAYNTKGEYGMKTSLKDLTRIFLGRAIQNHGAKGHSSAEDAIATLELVLLKLQHDITFGDCLQDGLMAASFEMHDDWYTDMINGITPACSDTEIIFAVNGTTESINGSINGTTKVSSEANSEKNVVVPGTAESVNGADDCEKCHSPGDKRKCQEKHRSNSKKLKQFDDKSNVTDDDKSDVNETHLEYVNEIATDKSIRNCRKGKCCVDSNEVTDNSIVIDAEPANEDGTQTVESTGESSSTGCHRVGSCEFLFNTVQKSHFFSRDHSAHTSLLEYAANSNKSVSLINETGISNDHCESFPRMEHLTTSTDKEARVEALVRVRETDFTWVRLRRYENLLEGGDIDDTSIENCLRKLDRRAAKIVTSAPIHSACIVVMSGRPDESGEHNAKVFLKTQILPP